MSKRSLFMTTPTPTRPLIAPSILSADFARLGEQCTAVFDAGADLLHIDVMDGHFVPNLSMGPAICASVHNALPDAFLDVHLMVTDPQKMIQPFAQAGANHITFHIEATNDAPALAKEIHDLGLTAGIALSPPTDARAVENVLEYFELVLVMTVHPGFSGQAFLAEMMEKAKTLRGMMRQDQRLEVDGGVNQVTAVQCRDAGCDVLVAASAIFGSNDYHAAISAIRGS